jgi:hypothetical protein
MAIPLGLLAASGISALAGGLIGRATAPAPQDGLAAPAAVGRGFRRRTVDVAVDLATGKLVIVPSARKKRRAKGARLRKTERELLEAARRQMESQAMINQALAMSVLARGGGH